ncbi:hypothetical protein BCR35DRAFT_303859, partial [Leucosporidium creatinivorum]
MALLRTRARFAFTPCTCSSTSPLLRRQLSTSPRSFAPFLFTSLPSRAVIPIQGKDATKLLQGLVSNDVARLEKGETRALYAAMLKADGRMLHDIFLFPSSAASPPAPSSADNPTPPTPSYLLDHPSSSTDSIRKYLKRHILRSKVKLPKPVEGEEGKVMVAWRNREEEITEQQVDEAREWLEAKVGAGRDGRVEGMGWRWCATPGEPSAEEPSSYLFEQTTPHHYHLHRLSHAVPEGPEDFPPLPLEANLDFMGGVDYKKGCYVGQELTARTHHKGVVRKRGVGVRLFREGEDIPTTLLPEGALVPYPSLFPLPPPGSSLTLLHSTSSRPRPSGKLGSSLPLLSHSGLSTITLGFASVRLEHLEAQGEGPEADELKGVFVVKPPKNEDGEVGHGEGESEEMGGRWLARAFRSEWLEGKLEEEERGSLGS